MPRRTVSAALAVLCAAALSSGCSIKQQVTRFETAPRTVCIVEHAAVREGVLDALREGFGVHDVDTRLIEGDYLKQPPGWRAHWQLGEDDGCDAVALYVANWAWDLAMYMFYAEIRMMSVDGRRVLAHATYDASAGGGRLDKFISAREKILELVGQMMAGERAAAD